MQFSLAWYLWAYLPFHNRDASGSLSPNPPELKGVWAPDQNGLPKFSICRTNPAVQVICIGLFLFYILNSVPGILKNALIVLWSCKFVSEDTNGVLRIHFWRSCSFWAGLASFLRKPFALENIDRGMLRFFTHDAGGERRSVFFLPLSKELYPWSVAVPPYVEGRLPAGCDDWIMSARSTRKAEQEPKTRLEYEVAEMRAFMRRKLAAINPEVYELCLEDFDVKQKQEDEEDLSSAEALEWRKRYGEHSLQSVIKEQRRKIEELIVEKLEDETRETVLDLQGELDDLEAEAEAAETERRNKRIDRTRDAAEYLVCLDYCDGTSKEEIRRVKDGYHAKLLSVIAFVFGVLPEVVATTMILISGVQYVLWSGSKIGSDTSGIEEIVLASLAIAFINDVDEALYDHALPELYKTAHERDRFGLENWIPAEEPAEMEEEATERFLLRPRPEAQPDPSPGPGGRWSHAEPSRPGEAPRYYSEAAFRWCMRLSKSVLEHMSNEKHSDPCFCEQYPFLYARKYRYFFQQHLFEWVIWAYGARAFHVVVLGAASLAIVGGFRTAHGCTGAQGALSFYSWPNTCDTWNLTTAGVCS